MPFLRFWTSQLNCLDSSCDSWLLAEMHQLTSMHTLQLCIDVAQSMDVGHQTTLKSMTDHLLLTQGIGDRVAKAQSPAPRAMQLSRHVSRQECCIQRISFYVIRLFRDTIVCRFVNVLIISSVKIWSLLCSEFDFIKRLHFLWYLVKYSYRKNNFFLILLRIITS